MYTFYFVVKHWQPLNIWIDVVNLGKLTVQDIHYIQKCETREGPEGQLAYLTITILGKALQHFPLLLLPAPVHNVHVSEVLCHLPPLPSHTIGIKKFTKHFSYFYIKYQAH